MNCMSRISFLWTTRRNVFLPEPWKLEGLFEDDFACTLTDCKSRRAFGLSFEKSCSSCQEDFPSDSYVHSGQAARMNMFVENALTCRQPEHYNRLSFATLDFTWYLDLKHAPGTIVEVYESCQATLNVMPREACVDWISRFLSFIARFTSCLVDSCLDDMDLRTMDFHRKTAALVRLALKESMVMVVTWKAKSSAVAELWVSVVSYLMKLPKSVISLPRLSSRVKKALSYAKKLSCHWPLRKELQFKVILLWLTASAFPISRDESLWRWLSLIEYLHADDVYIVLAIRGLRCRLLEDEKNNSSDVRIHSKSCVCCGRPELGTAHYFILCRDCLRPENFFFETPTHPFSRSPALPQGAVTILIPRSAEDCVGYDCPD